MKELKNFYNEGFGWICRRCEAGSTPQTETGKHSRLLREGESEGKTPRLSSVALAKWTDQSRTMLVCPRCEITETVNR